MDYGYQGKRVIVTGCASGIGRATAAALAGLGAEVHGVDRTDITLDLAGFTTIDLADPASIATGADAIGGPVDALFNCAGATPMLPSSEILKVNFLGTRLLTELLVPSIPSGGAIVSVSSDGGYGWRKKLSLLQDFVSVETFDGGLAWYAEHEAQVGHAYSFAKEALNVWTLQQSQRLIHQGVRINTVSPGAVQTPMLEAIEATYPIEMISVTEQPIGRRSTPVEQAAALLFLNSVGASYVNGADLPVDGGYWASLSLTGSLWG